MKSEQSYGFNRDTIKYIAMFTMLLKHISSIFLDHGTFLAELFQDVGYFTAPAPKRTMRSGFSCLLFYRKSRSALRFPMRASFNSWD